MLKKLFVDLHIHVGRTRTGQHVKISASPRLTLENIIEEAACRKGLDVIGIVDAASPPVIDQLMEYVDTGLLSELREGGLVSVRNGRRLTVLLGVEAGAASGGGEAHFLSYFPKIADVRSFSRALSRYVSNVGLSSQKTRLSPSALLALTKDYGGRFFLAHAFTPHKGYYGISSPSLSTAFSDREMAEVDGIELGLSADTSMASSISETADYPYITNSDAHSPETIAREYMLVRTTAAHFNGVFEAIASSAASDAASTDTALDQACIVANYGLAPGLGKYHLTYCSTCQINVPLNPDRRCPTCRGTNVTVGVYDRLREISNGREDKQMIAGRPPYIHQVPLRFIPGIGPKTLKRLLDHFGTEMNVLHDATEDELASVLPEQTVRTILLSRDGHLEFQSGGGGRYGRVRMSNQ